MDKATRDARMVVVRDANEVVEMAIRAICRKEHEPSVLIALRTHISDSQAALELELSGAEERAQLAVLGAIIDAWLSE